MLIWLGESNEKFIIVERLSTASLCSNCWPAQVMLLLDQDQEDRTATTVTRRV